ncbi:MAG: hypothetical protein M3Z66_05560 [Chloroflexota bacterium]|nr:hypothetical protein [Chloroflexota bacterium]
MVQDVKNPGSTGVKIPDDDFNRADLQEELRSDFTTSAVPLDHRKSTLHMTLVWITGNCAFSTLYTGYVMRQSNLNFTDLIISTLIGNVILLGYWFGASYLGASFGQTETLLARSFLGRWGSYAVSLLIVVASSGWYMYQADLFATMVTALLNASKYVAVISLIFGLLMMFNNLFGFTSVSIWAKYVAAPILMIWVIWAFAKAFATTSSHVLFAAPHGVAAMSLGVGASTIVGGVIWGSEPDFWRWSKPKPRASIVPIVAAVFLGSFLFPVTGWALAQIQNITAFGKVVIFITQYTLGFAAIGVLVFVITQVAVNDLNLYEVVTAAKNVLAGPRYIYVLVFGTIGAIGAYFQVINYYVKIAELTGILVPCVTVIMMLDAWVVPKLFGLKRNVHRVPEWQELAHINVPAIVAVAAGILVGSYTGAILDPNFSWGIAPLNAWVVASVFYLVGVGIVKATTSPETRDTLLGYSESARQATPSVTTTVIPAGE